MTPMTSKHTNNEGHSLVRVLFLLEPDSWHGSATERLWAEPAGGDRYRLRNSPFFAFDVSVGDIVFGREEDGQIVFAGVSLRGGHSTYRIKIRPDSSSRYLHYWLPLQQLGCSYEQGEVLAVDVPPYTDIHEVYKLLEAGEAANVWDFEEGHCGHDLAQ